MPEASVDDDDDDAYLAWLKWSNGLPLLSALLIWTLVALINAFPWFATRQLKEASILCFVVVDFWYVYVSFFW